MSSYGNRSAALPSPWRTGGGFALAALCGGLFTSACVVFERNIGSLFPSPLPFFVGTGLSGYIGGLFFGRGWRTAASFAASFASFPLLFVLISWLASLLISASPESEGSISEGLALGSVAAIGAFFATRDRHFAFVAFASFLFGGLVGAFSARLTNFALNLHNHAPAYTTIGARVFLVLPFDMAAVFGLFSGGTLLGFAIRYREI